MTTLTTARKIGLALASTAISVATLSACSSSPNDPEPSAPATSVATSPSVRPSAEPEKPKTDLGGPTVRGLGYTVQAHAGWSDGTDRYRISNPSGVTVDRVLLWGDAFHNSRAVVIIETSPGRVNAADWRGALLHGDASAQVTSVDIVRDAVDGENAVRMGITRTNSADVRVEQRAFKVTQGDRSYSITLSYKAGDDDVLTLFDEILATWTWDTEDKDR